MNDPFEHPWLGALFGDAEASAIWSPEAQIGHYKEFEIALAFALEGAGRVAPGVARYVAWAIREFEADIEELARGTGSDGLPIPELVRQIREFVGSFLGDANVDTNGLDLAGALDAIHVGATSQDVLDTAQALSLQRTSDLALARIASLEQALGEIRDRHGKSTLTGRTRMQAALPITVGHRVESWLGPLAGHAERLRAVRPKVELVQLGGPVGTGDSFGENRDGIAWTLAERLGLRSDGKVRHADRAGIAEYASCLSLISGGLGKMGQDMCLMAQQGVDEIEFSSGGGSSAMEHKRNPVLAELLVTLARFNASQLAAMHQALVHEQERSGAAWMLEWLTLPKMAVATCRSLAAARELCGMVAAIGADARGTDR